MKAVFGHLVQRHVVNAAKRLKVFSPLPVIVRSLDGSTMDFSQIVVDTTHSHKSLGDRDPALNVSKFLQIREENNVINITLPNWPVDLSPSSGLIIAVPPSTDVEVLQSHESQILIRLENLHQSAHVDAAFATVELERLNCPTLSVNASKGSIVGSSLLGKINLRALQGDISLRKMQATEAALFCLGRARLQAIYGNTRVQAGEVEIGAAHGDLNVECPTFFAGSVTGRLKALVRNARVGIVAPCTAHVDALGQVDFFSSDESRFAKKFENSTWTASTSDGSETLEVTGPGAATTTLASRSWLQATQEIARVLGTV